MNDTGSLIEALDLQPHPEGGYYVETWRADTPEGERPSGTAIYYLLRAGERSHWHRIDAVEVWHHYAGDPLALSMAPGDGEGASRRYLLGPDVASGQRPQIIVPAGEWQSAESTGDWTLVGCTVSPGFRFEGFELAGPGWAPVRAEPGGAESREG